MLPEFVLEESLLVPIEPGWLWSELLLLFVPELVPELLPADHAGATPTQVPANKIADNERYFLFIPTPFVPFTWDVFDSISRPPLRSGASVMPRSVHPVCKISPAPPLTCSFAARVAQVRNGGKPLRL